jgi:hypothetical protein
MSFALELASFEADREVIGQAVGSPLAEEVALLSEAGRIEPSGHCIGVQVVR